MAGLFYTKQNKHGLSEGLYRIILDANHYGKPEMNNSLNLVMALSFYGRMLLESDLGRKREAENYI
jgi:hypothetical protein